MMVTGWARGSNGNCVRNLNLIYDQMVYKQPCICPGKWDTKTLQGFWHKIGSPPLGQMTRPYYNHQQKKWPCKLVDFAVPADHWVKLKDSQKKDKYHVLA